MKRLRSFSPAPPPTLRSGLPRLRTTAVKEYVRAELEIARLERDLEQLRRRGQKTFLALSRRRDQAEALHALLDRTSGGKP